MKFIVCVVFIISIFSLKNANASIGKGFELTRSYKSFDELDRRYVIRKRGGRSLRARRISL